jgi:hypothetical protein
MVNKLAKVSDHFFESAINACSSPGAGPDEWAGVCSVAARDFGVGRPHRSLAHHVLYSPLSFTKGGNAPRPWKTA